jgi:putative transposase
LGVKVLKREKPGGTGFQPVQSFQIKRRYLPHWQQPGSVYFVTWRCKEGKTLKPEDCQITLATLRYWDEIKWNLLAAVVLPDHVHLLAQPLPRPEGGVFDLGEILHSVKRHSARTINQLRGAQGSLWQDERYDRIMRDENEFFEKWTYIKKQRGEIGIGRTTGRISLAL